MMLLPLQTSRFKWVNEYLMETSCLAGPPLTKGTKGGITLVGNEGADANRAHTAVDTFSVGLTI